MTGRVEGKVAFVTGAARGQGRSHAVTLAKEGADIIGIDVVENTGTYYDLATPDDLAETVRLVEAQDRRMIAAKADVRDFDQVRTALDDGVAQLGHVDIVLANAGIIHHGPSHEQTEDQWRLMIDTNLTGVWHTTKAATSHLISQNTGGAIIITSSVAGLRVFPNLSGYVAAKWGVVGLGRTLAHELAPYRVRVNTVHPTNVQTPMIDNAPMRALFAPDIENPTSDDVADRFCSTNLWPMPWIQPQDVSDAIVFLASDEGRHITGTELRIDLGATIK